MFFIGLTRYRPESPLCSALSEPVTSSFDSGRWSAWRRGDPFSHPSGSSAGRAGESNSSTLNRKAGPKGHSPPARCCRQCPNTLCVRLRQGRLCDPFVLCLICFHLPAPGVPPWGCVAGAHPAAAGPEDVQCRSVFIHILKNSGSPGPVAKARVQPVFDSRHGRIACKAFSPAPLRWRNAAASNHI